MKRRNTCSRFSPCDRESRSAPPRRGLLFPRHSNSLAILARNSQWSRIWTSSNRLELNLERLGHSLTNLG